MVGERIKITWEQSTPSHHLLAQSLDRLHNWRSTAAKQTAIFFPVAGWTVCVRRSLMSHPSIIHHHIYGPVSQLIQINGAYRKHERKLQGQKINQLTARSISRGKWVIFSLLMVHCALLSYIGYTHYKYTIKIWGIDSLEPQLGSLNMMCFSPFAVNRSKFSKLLRVFNRQTFEIQLNKLKRWG